MSNKARAVPALGSLKVKDLSMREWRKTMDAKCAKVKLMRDMIQKDH